MLMYFLSLKPTSIYSGGIVRPHFPQRVSLHCLHLLDDLPNIHISNIPRDVVKMDGRVFKCSA